ncbi:MAG: 5-(carboxyamino)imidazole ribonucleotide synthase [Pseudomonadota bacterium]
MKALAPGSVIGILGGGQLGRMLALEAARLGFDVHIFCPEPDSPAGRVSARQVMADYDNLEALTVFARDCDVVTYEFENVPVMAVEAVIDAGTHVRPGAKSLQVSQDRLTEKTFLNEIGIPTVAFRALETGDHLPEALNELGGAGILKTRRAGYDGKGQILLRDPDPDTSARAKALASEVPCILEAFAPFEREISAVVTRSEAGTVAFEPSENDHDNGILRCSSVPANTTDEVRSVAIDAGTRLAEALDHIGVLALEFFVMPGGDLLANELAPRVHNSGHWTPDACDTGQFEQHIRAVAGWPLGPVTRRFDVVMENILGPEIEAVPNAYNGADRLVSYGKRGAPDRRKVAHVTKRITLVR